MMMWLMQIKSRKFVSDLENSDITTPEKPPPQVVKRVSLRMSPLQVIITSVVDCLQTEQCHVVDLLYSSTHGYSHVHLRQFLQMTFWFRFSFWWVFWHLFLDQGLFASVRIRLLCFFLRFMFFWLWCIWLSAQVQFIAWKIRLQSDLFCVERDVEHCSRLGYTSACNNV